jgi:folylpolyglutamate synthase/dihydropteroate synthase
VVAFGDTPGRTSEELLEPFQYITSHIITTTIPAEALAGMHPSRSAVVLLAAARSYGIDSQAVPQLEDALRVLLQRPEPVLVVTGSLYLMDPAGTLLDTITGS